MAECTTVTVEGPSVDEPTVENLDVSTDVNSLTAEVTIDNPNDVGVNLDSILTIDNSDEKENIDIGSDGSETVTFNADFDISPGESTEVEVCADIENVSV